MDSPALTSQIDLSDDLLKQIRDHAFDLLTWKDIAYLVGIQLDAFKRELDNPNSAVHLAYHIGRAERKKQLRGPILKLAEIGSPQAELLASQFLEEQDLSETHD